MAEYIEREAIKFELWCVGPLNSPLMVVRKKTVDSIPAADVAPVVRCKDCLYYGDEYFCPLRSLADYTDPNDFGCMGERKGDDGSD